MQQARIDEARTRRPLSEIIRLTVHLTRAGRQWQGLCPFHKERTPSFYVDDARGTFKCYGCSAWGDAIDFVMLSNGVGFTVAVETILGEAMPTAHRRLVQASRDEALEDETRRIHHAHELWLRRQPLEDTLAFEYLCVTRKIRRPYPDMLGHVSSAYCSVRRETTPALIAPLQDSNGHVTAVQQIFLNPESSDAHRDEHGKRIKRTIGVMRDGCVRLGVPTATLGLAGSVEDALSASKLFSLPVWATCGEARMATVWVPSDVTRLIIFADADEAGERMAADAVKRQARLGLKVSACPPAMQKDWNMFLADREEKREKNQPF